MQIKVGHLSTDYTYDAQGNVTGVTAKDTLLNTSKAFKYTYTSNGLLSQQIDSKGYITKYTYDTQGNLAKVSNPLGQSTAYTYDTAGKVLTATEANAVKMQYNYDVRGRVSSINKTNISTATSPALRAVYTYTYTPTGQLLKAALPTGQTVSYTYDAAQRLIKVSDTLGNSIQYTLDLLGNLIDTKTADKNNVLSHAVSYTYDALNRPIQAMGVSQLDKYTYDSVGNSLSRQNVLDQTTQTRYDALNRPVNTSQADNGMIQTAYTPLDQVASITGSINDKTQYTQTAFNEATAINSPDTGKSQYTYDANGNIISRTDALGNISTYTYDALNRPTTISHIYNKDITKNSRTALVYDENSVAQPGNIGRLTSITSAVLKQTYQYDGFGRLVASKQTDLVNMTNTTGINTTNTARTTQYSYTAGNQLLGIIYPSGLKVGYQYNGGHISSILINGKVHISQIKYNASGVLIGGVFANGEMLKRTYNTSGQPTATALATYTVDAAGTIKGINTAINTNINNTVSATQINQNVILGYDAMNRLTRWADTYTQTPAAGTQINTTATADYTWDSNANRQSSLLNQSSQINTQAATTTKNTQTLKYSVGNRLSNNTTTRLVGTVANNTNQAIIIDAVGNTTNDGLRQYRYTAGNQLSSILSAGKNTAYTYDINNRRVSKISGTSSTAYSYAEDIGEGSTALSATSLLGEYTTNNTNTAIKEYVYLGDTPIAVVQVGNILTVQTDHLDTPRQLTDNTKKIVWNWAYSAFGENQPTTTNNTVFNLRYPGQYYDAESKLHYNINRYYDPATGRYTQSDPIGLSGGINTYTYVGGNTVRWSDRTGLEKWDFDGIGDTSFCSYYSQRAKETCGDTKDYYKKAAEICRGENGLVNTVVNLGIRDSWLRYATDKSASQILTGIRQGLIINDSRLVDKYGQKGVTGDMIDNYHNKVFNQNGVRQGFYGGNLWPQGLSPNPVPRDGRLLFPAKN